MYAYSIIQEIHEFLNVYSHIPFTNVNNCNYTAADDAAAIVVASMYIMYCTCLLELHVL